MDSLNILPIELWYQISNQLDFLKNSISNNNILCNYCSKYIDLKVIPPLQCVFCHSINCSKCYSKTVYSYRGVHGYACHKCIGKKN